MAKNIRLDYNEIREDLGLEDILFTDHPDIHSATAGKTKEEKLKYLNKKMKEWKCTGWANLDMYLKKYHMEGKLKISNMW